MSIDIQYSCSSGNQTSSINTPQPLFNSIHSSSSFFSSSSRMAYIGVINRSGLTQAEKANLIGLSAGPKHAVIQPILVALPNDGNLDASLRAIIAANGDPFSLSFVCVYVVCTCLVFFSFAFHVYCLLYIFLH